MHAMDDKLQWRRETVFLILAAFFFGAMTMLNIMGITRFVNIGPLAVAVGVLPYPLTFLCTDLISELFGKRRATLVVWIGLVLNIFVIFVMWLAHILPSVADGQQPPWQFISLLEPVHLPSGGVLEGRIEFFDILYACTAGSVVASMFAYLAAQLCDVHLFHFWKKLTKGRHLWVRNNFSTMVSQLVDSIAVVGITFGAVFWSGGMTLKAMFFLVFSNYLFKLASAIVDTLPFYVLTKKLTKYLGLEDQTINV